MRIILIFFSLSSLNCYSDDDIQTRPGFDEIGIYSSVYYLKNNISSYTIEDMLALTKDKFIRAKVETDLFRAHDLSYHWFKVDLKKLKNKKGNWYVVPSNFVKELKYFLVADGQVVESGLKGKIYNNANKDRYAIEIKEELYKENHVFIYIKIRYDYVADNRFIFMSEKKYEEKTLFSFLFWSFYYGVLLGLFIYNSLGYFLSKDVTYKWYVIFLVVLCVNMMVIFNPFKQYQYAIFGYLGHFSIFTTQAMVVFAMQFTRIYLNLSIEHPKYNRIFIYLMLAPCILFPFSFFTENKWFMALFTLVDMFSILIALFLAYKLYKAGNKSVRLLFLGWTSLFLATLVLDFGILFPEFAVVDADYIFPLGSLAEMLIMSVALTDRMNLIKLSTLHRVEENERNLEIKVEERTLELKTKNNFIEAMINSLGQGLVVFDKNNICNDIYTKACESIFGKSPKGRTFANLLGINTKKDKTTFDKWSQIMFGGVVPFECSSGLGPNKIESGKPEDLDYKYIGIEYFPMYNNDRSKMDNIIAVATNKTNEKKAIEESKNQNDYASMITKIAKNKTSFRAFLTEVNGLLKELSERINEDIIDENKILILYHTLCGGFSMYNISRLHTLTSSYEVELNDREFTEDTQEVDSFRKKLNEDLEILKEEYKDLLQFCDDLFGININKGSSFVEVSADVAKLIIEEISSINNTKNKEFILNQLSRESIIDYFSGYSDLCIFLALKLGKKVNPIKFFGGELRIESKLHAELFTTLVHLFRNCVDHGIETPKIRLANNKTAEGNIKVIFDHLIEDDIKYLKITISDDGGGINPKLIREKITLINPEEDYSKYSDEEIIYQIFEPRFSTRDEVSLISGKGVGMSAIKYIIDKKSGSISISSSFGKGSEFILKVPTT